MHTRVESQQGWLSAGIVLHAAAEYATNQVLRVKIKVL